MSAGLVFSSCCTCQTGAIHVPEVGPMGDEFHTTIEEAVASGQHWKFVASEWMCPRCVDLGEDARMEGEGLG